MVRTDLKSASEPEDYWRTRDWTAPLTQHPLNLQSDNESTMESIQNFDSGCSTFDFGSSLDLWIRGKEYDITMNLLNWVGAYQSEVNKRNLTTFNTSKKSRRRIILRFSTRLEHNNHTKKRIVVNRVAKKVSWQGARGGPYDYLVHWLARLATKQAETTNLCTCRRCGSTDWNYPIVFSGKCRGKCIPPIDEIGSFAVGSHRISLPWEMKSVARQETTMILAQKRF